MKLLFINVASKVFHDKEGNLYLNPHITNEGFRQYHRFCDELTLLLRDGGEISNTEQYERFDPSVAELHVYPNPFNVKAVLNPMLHRSLRRLIKEQVSKCDKVICGSQGGYVIETVIKYCKKYNKSYMVYCLGMMFEGQWYHSLKGKLVAFPREWSCKRVLRDAPYVIYVTREASQKRYPCKGKTLGCSDVELTDLSPQTLAERVRRIEDAKDEIVVGTAAYLDVRWKGHHVMLKALSMLKEKGYHVKYEMIGLGTGERIKKLARKYGVEDCILIKGAVPHNKIHEWYDHIDIYVQPSYQEGLCRSVVEAMSRACPVVCSDVGGNYELIERRFLFPRGNAKALCDRLEAMMPAEMRLRQAERNFAEAHNYQRDVLNERRWAFIKDFMASGEQI